MRSGLESTSNRNYGAWVQSSNWVRHALAKPLLAAPGTQMIYSTGNSHLLSAILTKATGKSTWQFAQETLAKPLGFSLSPWMRDPQGIYFGGNEMVMTPRQMLAFGEMYRNGGQVNGRQILSKAFIDDTFEPRGRSQISGREYGYGWWMRDMAGRQGVLRMGLWRPVHRPRAEPRPDCGIDLGRERQRRSTRPPPHGRRDHRTAHRRRAWQWAGLKSCATRGFPVDLLISALFRCATICDSSTGAVWP